MTVRSELERELGGPSAVLDALSEDETADLLNLFLAAQQQERTSLVEAIDTMIRALPWPFRATTKKIMFGSRIS